MHVCEGLYAMPSCILSIHSTISLHTHLLSPNTHHFSITWEQNRCIPLPDSFSATPSPPHYKLLSFYIMSTYPTYCLCQSPPFSMPSLHPCVVLHHLDLTYSVITLNTLTYLLRYPTPETFLHFIQSPHFYQPIHSRLLYRSTYSHHTNVPRKYLPHISVTINFLTIFSHYITLRPTYSLYPTL